MCPKLLFAFKKDDNRWRFRVDDIGHFVYVANKSPYENYDLLVNTLKIIYSIIKKQTISNYIKRLLGYAKNLKNERNHYYIEMLISDVERKCLELN